jgi:hypothetical protein
LILALGLAGMLFGIELGDFGKDFQPELCRIEFRSLIRPQWEVVLRVCDWHGPLAVIIIA